MLHMTTIFIYIDPINSRHSCKYTYSMIIRRILGYGPGLISTYPYFIFDRSQLLVFVQHLKSSSCRLPRFFSSNLCHQDTLATSNDIHMPVSWPSKSSRKSQRCQFARRNWGGEFAVAERFREVNLNKVTIYNL